MRIRRRRRLSLVLVSACVLLMAPTTAHAGRDWGPLPPHNPHLGPQGTASMHSDAASSDATPLAGPGTGAISVAKYRLASACPTILQGSDGLVVALCTAIVDRSPTVHLIDPAEPRPVGTPLAQLKLAKGSLLGGVYAYLDDEDRLIAVDGNHHLIRVGHSRNASGQWQLTIEKSTDLSSAIPADDNVTGLVPDYDGNIWFATANARVGVVNASGDVSTLRLPAGEHVRNSISSSPKGVAVATTHALYELTADRTETPQIRWRSAYDRGSARKPGQLSWGTGSTPTYFGPRTGAEYLTIVDNADGQANLLVFRSGSGDLVCSQPVLTHGGPGSENSPIAIGRSVFVASTYGYPYPAVPEDVAPAQPKSAPFVGGMTRVDVDENGCHTVWNNEVRSAAVPHISTADGNIYTISRVGLDITTPLDGYQYTVVDPTTGAVTADHLLPGTVFNDPLQTSPLITSGGQIMQGTLTGIMRIS